MAKKKTIKDIEVTEVEKKKEKMTDDTVDELEAVEDDFEELSIDKVSEVKSENSKVDKKKDKREKNKSNKEDKKESYTKSLNRELKKVDWPKAGIVAKYTLAVVLFCVILCLFFEGINLLAAFIKGLFV